MDYVSILLLKIDGDKKRSPHPQNFNKIVNRLARLLGKQPKLIRKQPKLILMH